jgi:predicted membrane protein
MFKLCAPSLIYLVFSLTQIIIDTFKGLYNTALMKCIVMILCTFLLNALCETGMSIISWIIVFIPFMLMTVIVSILLYIFGLDIATGQYNYKNKTTNSNANIQMVYTTGNNNNNNNNSNNGMSPSGSSSPAYESFSSNNIGHIL